MKKITPFLCIFTLFSFASFYGLELELIDDDETLKTEDFIANDTSVNEYEDYDVDELDAIFDNAEDVENAIVEEPKNDVNQFLSNTNIKLSGHFDFDVALGLDISEIANHINEQNSEYFMPAFGIILDNYLYLTATPSDVFQLKGSLYTAITNRFVLDLNTLYCNYAPLDHLYISAGKKSIKWGYPRLFSDGSFYGNGDKYQFTGKLLTDVMCDSNNKFTCELRFPWNKGTVTGILLYDYKNGSVTDATGLDQLGYAFSSEISVPHFAFNFFGRNYGEQEQGKFVDPKGNLYSEKMNPLAGLEGKVTVGGFDSYAQGIFRVKNRANVKYQKEQIEGDLSVPSWEYGLLTLGCYKIWDSSDPNFGFNLEYQYQCFPTYAGYIENQHRTALQIGVKRMGNKKNLKIAADWYQNWTEMNGQTSITFIVGNILKYANLNNTVLVQYGKNLDMPKILLASVVTIDVDY